MNTRVCIDDPVTYVDGPCTICEHVEAVARTTFTTAAGKTFRHEDEGGTWARGHHLPDSETVKALNASGAMAEHVLPPPAPGPFPPTQFPPPANPPPPAPAHQLPIGMPFPAPPANQPTPAPPWPATVGRKL